MNAPGANDKPSLKGVGGLTDVLRELRELVELPLKRPDLLTMLGLEPTSGVLWWTTGHWQNLDGSCPRSRLGGQLHRDRRSQR
jgi:hypothetical protein